MPKTGTTIPVAGIYRSDCCGIEWTMLANHTFPPCGGSKPNCKGSETTWTLVRKTPTK